jgi:rare lipoprotein A
MRAEPARLVALAAALALAAGCASTPAPVASGDGAPARPPDVSRIPDPVPRAEPRSSRGNPPFYEVLGRRYYVMSDATGYRERGIASWYGTKFHGRSTSSGEPYDMYAMTAAHKTLPLPTYVRVTHRGNGRSIIVRVNDRGPFVGERIIDLSYAAAVRLGMHNDGTALVDVEALKPGALPEIPVVAVAEEPLAESQAVWLQVGAFTEGSNAERLRARLAAEGIDGVVLQPEHLGLRNLYRVRIGPLFEVEAIEEMLGRVRAMEIHDAHLAMD